MQYLDLLGRWQKRVSWHFIHKMAGFGLKILPFYANFLSFDVVLLELHDTLDYIMGQLTFDSIQRFKI